jgi:hypothetical protein
MTSIDPQMLQWDADRLERDGIYTPEQAARLREAQSRVASLSAPVPPVEEPTAYRFGQALRSAIPTSKQITPEMRSAMDNSTPAGTAVSVLGAAGNQVREVLRGASNRPSLASEERARADATMQDANGSAPPAAASAPPAMLRRHEVAYPTRTGGGGGGLGSITRELGDIGRAQTAAAGDQVRRLDANAESARGAILDEAAVQADKLTQQGAAFRDGLQQQELNDAAATERYQRQRDAIGAEEKKTQGAISAAEQLSVDPQRWYGSLSTGGKIGAGIAVAFGALGAALTGGPNQALGIIQKAIDDDITAQRVNMDKAGRDVDRRFQALRDMRTNLQDDVQFDNVLRAQHWDDVTKRMQNIDFSSAPAEIQTQANRAIVDATAKRDEARSAIVERALANAQQNAAARGSVIAQQASLGLQREQLANKADRANPQTVREVQEIQGTAQSTIDKIRRLREFVLGPDGVGREVFPTDDAKKATAMSRDLQLALKEQKKMGTLDKGSEAFLESLVTSDPTQMNQGALKAQLDALEASTKSETAAQLRARGVDVPNTSLKDL